MGNCENCDGRGWVIEPDAGAGRARRCECQGVVAIESLLRESGLEAAEFGAALAPWDTSASAAPRKVIEWAKAAAAGETGEAWAMVLLGEAGRGKTKAAAMALATWCAATGRAGLWVNIPEGVPRVMHERRDEDLRGGGLELAILNARFLVLDDLGFERKDGPRAEAVAEWLHYRHRRQLPTLVTSNAADLDGLGDARISSRLGDGQDPILLMSAIGDYRDHRTGSNPRGVVVAMPRKP
jgi:DNA replication protein DnaC